MQGRVQRALVSVYDKDGVVDLCRALAEMGVEILSSGGTSRLLSERSDGTTSDEKIASLDRKRPHRRSLDTVVHGAHFP